MKENVYDFDMKSNEKKKLETDNVPSIFVSRLEDLLKKNKIKKYKFAELIGVSEDTIYSWTSTNKKPEWIEIMYRMFNYLTMNVKDFDPKILFCSNEEYQELKRKQSQESLRLEREKESLRAEIEKSNQLNNLAKNNKVEIIKPYLKDKKFLANPEMKIFLPLLREDKLLSFVDKIKKAEDNRAKFSYDERIKYRDDIKTEIYKIILKALKIESPYFLADYYYY